MGVRERLHDHYMQCYSQVPLQRDGKSSSAHSISFHNSKMYNADFVGIPGTYLLI